MVVTKQKTGGGGGRRATKQLNPPPECRLLCPRVEKDISSSCATPKQEQVETATM